ncbi:ionotropic receptor 21a [Procambarus clarkii]|uniref:ionotropic receptor 21a n=1 Tax=Procambarus clarkii TaxID=6728 RepID=UPI003741FE55
MTVAKTFLHLIIWISSLSNLLKVSTFPSQGIDINHNITCNNTLEEIKPVLCLRKPQTSPSGLTKQRQTLGETCHHKLYYRTAPIHKPHDSESLEHREFIHDGRSATLKTDTPAIVLENRKNNEALSHLPGVVRRQLTALREAVSLSQMLRTAVSEEMQRCHLVVAYDPVYDQLTVVEDLLMQLPNTRQVVRVSRTDDLLKIAWVSPECGGYIFLTHDQEPLLTFVNTFPDLWDYHGRYLFVTSSQGYLESLASSKKGKKTEYIAGATQTGLEGEWSLYINQLYFGEGVKRVTSWRKNRFTSQVVIFPDKFTDLRGAVLKVGTFEWKPFVFYERARDGTVVSRYGRDMGVVNILSQVINFTTQFKEPPAGEYWGSDEENGTYSGFLGLLARNEVDLGVVDLYVTIVRVDILDYTLPYDNELSCFLARTEPPIPRWQALAFPFQGQTWTAILFGLLVSGPVLYILARCSAHCGAEEKRLQSLGFDTFYTLAMHCARDQRTEPQTDATRVYVLFLWLYTMILTIAYSSNLTAFLLVAKAPTGIETLKDLHDTGTEVSVVGTFSPTDPNLQSIKDRFKNYSSDEPIFSRVLEGKSVMLMSRPYHEYVIASRFTSRGQARMRIMKECFTPFNVAMALQRHSPLKRRFDQIIGWMVSGGLVNQFFQNDLTLSLQHSVSMSFHMIPLMFNEH